MTHTAEQERAEFEAWWRGYTKSTKSPRFEGGAYIFPAANTAWNTWQAARRAQVVPDAYLVYAKGSTRYWVVTLNPDDVPEIYKGGETVPLYRNAAAPQPPEAAQLDDIGVVDMAQAVDSKEAASVQLPEPVAKIEGGSLKWHIPDTGYSLPVRYLQGTENLYTEHQVRQLLSAREQST